jgi:hypothetical protein
MDGNDKLESLLNDIISDVDKQKTLSSQLGVNAGNGATEGKEE